jgi:lysophospholipase L1-like esterase
MVFNLIPRLSDYCRQNGHTLKPAIWYASTTIAWGSQSKLDQLITEFDPTFVLIVLGSSELTSRSMDGRAESVRNMLKKIGPRQMAWVGPPNWRADTGINALLERELGKQRFFRSAELELERESDGIHPNRAAGSAWADLIAQWLEKESAAHIVMKAPETTGPAAVPVVFPPPYKVPP